MKADADENSVNKKGQPRDKNPNNEPNEVEKSTVASAFPKINNGCYEMSRRDEKCGNERSPEKRVKIFRRVELRESVPINRHDAD
jgi:hypothetical protein